jgi:acyl carrier protein
MENRTVEERVKREISEQLHIDPALIKNEAEIINDLGADSLEVCEITMALEDEFGMDVSDEEVERCSTVQSIIDLFTEKFKK